MPIKFWVALALAVMAEVSMVRTSGFLTGGFVTGAFILGTATGIALNTAIYFGVFWVVDRIRHWVQKERQGGSK